MKLLYAEDEAGMSEAVTDILTYHNYTVDVVYDGEEALAYARTERYDGIILDIMMPKLSGLDDFNFQKGITIKPIQRFYLKLVESACGQVYIRNVLDGFCG